MAAFHMCELDEQVLIDDFELLIRAHVHVIPIYM